MNPVKEAILNMLISAEGKGVSRSELSHYTRTDDRTVRKYIGELREEGYLIGQPENGGYSYGVMQDVQRTICKDEARINTIRRRNRKIKRAIANQNQLVFDV